MRILLGPVPGPMFLAGIVAALRFPISRQEHARIRVKLDRRKQAREHVLEGGGIP